MDVQHGRRAREDRREFVLYYRYGHERRNNAANRRLETVEALQPYFPGNVPQGWSEAPDRKIEMLKVIANAFGVPPDSLELLEHDDLLNATEAGQSH